jgi:two-component system response regulator
MGTNVILLVEDNPDDSELALRAFARAQVKCDVVLARDGVEALDYLLGTGSETAPPAPLPDVVLLDLKLPRIDGLDVLRRLRAETRTRHLPVIVLTSSEREDDIAASYALGANSYLRKPVEFARFSEVARQIGAYWLALNLTPRGA